MLFSTALAIVFRLGASIGGLGCERNVRLAMPTDEVVWWLIGRVDDCPWWDFDARATFELWASESDQRDSAFLVGTGSRRGVQRDVSCRRDRRSGWPD